MQGAQGNVKKRVVSGLPGAKVRCGTEHLSGSSQMEAISIISLPTTILVRVFSDVLVAFLYFDICH